MDPANLPAGFRYSALYAGIRKVARPDLALIVSEVEAAAAGVFTTNLVQFFAPQSGRHRRPGARGAGQRRQCQLRHAHW